jgi:PadR family transcriptional regulator, regulatory protein AphA
MSLRNALLGLLAARPMSGYDLTKTFDASLGNVWSARHSQIYPELARLQEEGLIRRHEQGPRGRKSYVLTEAGLRQVRRWLTETPPDHRHSRNEALLRSFFLWLMDPAEARAYLEGESAYHRGKLAEYEAVAAEAAPVTPPQRSFRIALEFGLRYERAMVEWAEWALEQVPAGGFPSAGGAGGFPPAGEAGGASRAGGASGAGLPPASGARAASGAGGAGLPPAGSPAPRGDGGAGRQATRDRPRDRRQTRTRGVAP